MDAGSGANHQNKNEVKKLDILLVNFKTLCYQYTAEIWCDIRFKLEIIFATYHIQHETNKTPGHKPCFIIQNKEPSLANNTHRALNIFN
jgi:hypothetical protein